MSFEKFSSSLPVSLSLKNRTALVTGSSSSIGRQTCLQLARLGANILCADLNPLPREDVEGTRQKSADGKVQNAEGVATHELINQLGGLADFYKTDVSDEDQFKGAVQAALKLSEKGGESPGRLDILVNNAGIADFSGGIANESLKTFEREMAVNTRGTYIGCQQAVRQMLKQSPRALPADSELDLDDIPFESLEKGGSEVELRKSYKEDEETPITSGRLGEEALNGEKDVGARGSRGVIINIGSIHGLIGGPGEPAYAASKGAVINLTRQVACDYAGQRINVNSINPGYLNTAMTLSVPPALAAQRPTLWPHRGVARDVAKTVVFLARDAPWMTGSTIALDGATTAR